MQVPAQPALVVLAIAVGLGVAGSVFLVLRRVTAGPGSLATVPRFLVATLVALGVLAGLALFALVAGLPFDRVAYTGLGLFVGVCTLLRPTWFWEHPRARAVRAVLGDGGTTTFYLIVAAALVYVGLFTRMTFGRGR